MNMSIARGPDTWRTVAARATDARIPQGNWMEHRWGLRRPCRARVNVSAGSGVAGRGRLRDVSLSGAFLETAAPLALFKTLTVAVLNDATPALPLEFRAVVVRKGDGGVGIEWCEEISGSICQALGCTVQCGYAGTARK